MFITLSRKIVESIFNLPDQSRPIFKEEEELNQSTFRDIWNLIESSFHRQPSRDVHNRRTRNNKRKCGNERRQSTKSRSVKHSLRRRRSPRWFSLSLRIRERKLRTVVSARGRYIYIYIIRITVSLSFSFCLFVFFLIFFYNEPVFAR